MNRKDFKELMLQAGFTNESLASDLNKGLNTVKNWGTDKNKKIPIEVIKYLQTKVELNNFKESETIKPYIEENKKLKTSIANCKEHLSSDEFLEEVEGIKELHKAIEEFFNKNKNICPRKLHYIASVLSSDVHSDKLLLLLDKLLLGQ